MRVPWLNIAQKNLSLSDLEIRLNTTWGSDHQNFRQAIRTNLVKNLENLKKSDQAILTSQERSLILNLDHLPHLNSVQISITHCEGIGGFAISQKAKGLGFDAEVDSRVQAKIVRRISEDTEFVNAPSSAALWVAKEASFKAIDRSRNLLISDIKIDSWHDTNDEGSHWNFKARFEDESALGFTTREGQWIFAIAVKES